MWGRVKALIIKEIWAVWSDKKSRFILIVPPLVQLLVFAFAATLEVKNVSMAVLNKDNGEHSFELVMRFFGSPTFNQIVHLKSEEEMREAIDTQKALIAIHLDEQFSRNINAGKNADVQIILDGRKSNSAQIVEGYAARIIDQFNQDLAKKKNLPPPKTEMITRSWFNPNLDYVRYTVPCLCGVLTMAVSLMVTALSVARERELGTFEQVLVSPLQPYEILIGKTVPSIIIAMGEGSLILFAAIFAFQIPFQGFLPLLYMSMLVFILSIIGIGLFLSSLCKTQQQAILGGFLFMSPAITLSGFATPIENMPDWLQTLTLANPLRYFLIIIKGVFLKDMSASTVLHYTWPMVIIAAFTLSASTWFFRRRIE
jgi:ABC-2 type transport system permease protein